VNGLSFASSLVGHLIWPAVVVAALLIFRRPLSDLLGRIRKYQGMGQTVEFQERLADAQQSVSKAAEEAPPTGKDLDEIPDNISTEMKLALTARESPSRAIRAAWDRLYDAVEDLHNVVLPVSPDFARDRMTHTSMMSNLLREDVITPSLFDAIQDLYLLWRSVIGGYEPSFNEAMEYVGSATRTSALLAFHRGQQEARAQYAKLQAERAEAHPDS
jgi:hypothetical protein